MNYPFRSYIIDYAKGVLNSGEGIDQLLADAKAMAKAARKVAGAEGWKGADISFTECDATAFKGYSETECKGKILAIAANGEKVDFIDVDTDAVIVLDNSSFYAEGIRSEAAFL